MPDNIKELQIQYLSQIAGLEKQIEDWDAQYLEGRKKLKKDLADLIERARFNSDLSVADIGKHLGKSRQAVNQLLIDVYGIRHPDRAELARKDSNA